MAGVIALAIWAAIAPVQAGDPFHITEAERAACTEDATRLCSGAYPDEHRLLACMTANRSSLSPACLAALNAGLKRRGL